MSELQLALIGFGIFLVAAVWGYNLWQEKRHRQHAERVLPAAAPDVLMADRGEAGMPVPEQSAVQREPTFAATNNDAGPDDAESETPPLAVGLPGEWADGRADCLLRIEFVDAVPVSALWEARTEWPRQIDKPVQWLGLDEKSGRWRSLLPQDPGTVTQVVVVLQLANRQGAVDASTLTAFLDGAHRLAQRFAGLVELPDAESVLAQARELDDFCAGVDLQLSFHVVPREGSIGEMAGARLKPVIDGAGLKLEGERFVAMNHEGAEVFGLACHVTSEFSAARLESMALTRLTFSLDVPRVADGTGGFDRMTACARQCAEALGGRLVDAHGHALGDDMLAAIRGRIDELQARMAQQGIVAGSVRALRLFS